MLIELLKKPFSGLNESCISLRIETLHFLRLFFLSVLERKMAKAGHQDDTVD